MEKSNLKHFIKLMTHYIQCHLEMHFRLYLKYFVQLFSLRHIIFHGHNGKLFCQGNVFCVCDKNEN